VIYLLSVQVSPSGTRGTNVVPCQVVGRGEMYLAVTFDDIHYSPGRPLYTQELYYRLVQVNFNVCSAFPCCPEYQKNWSAAGVNKGFFTFSVQILMTMLPTPLLLRPRLRMCKHVTNTSRLCYPLCVANGI
jgi:hypothetical protein